MAFRIRLDQLSPEQQKRVAQECIIKPTTKSYHQNSYYSEEPDSSTMYVIEDQYVYIPYYTASLLFGQPFPNRHLKYHKVPSFPMVDGFSLFEYQQEAIDVAMGYYQRQGTCFFNVFCAFGKTVVTIYLAHVFSQFGYRTCVTFPTDLIRKSWIGTVETHTKARMWVYQKDQVPPEDAQIILAMHTQLDNMSDDIKKTIGHLVIDEAHMFCTENRMHALLRFEPMYITVLTATYEKDNGLHVMIDKLAGPDKITKISSKPFFVWRYRTHCAPDPDMVTKTARGTNYTSIIKAMDFREDKNQIIVDLVKNNPNEKILVLVDHVPHVEHLYQLIKAAVSPERLVSKLTGKDKKYQDAHILVATFDKAGVGFDEKESCENWGGIRFNMGIFSNAGMKIEQPAGRINRCQTPVIIDVVDDHPILTKHFSARKKWYQSRNGIVLEAKPGFCWAKEYPKVKDLHKQKS